MGGVKGWIGRVEEVEVSEESNWIERYDLIHFVDESEMVRQDDGEWVRYSDVIRHFYEQANADIGRHLGAIMKEEE